MNLHILKPHFGGVKFFIYSKKTAKQIGQENLTKLDLKEYIENLLIGSPHFWGDPTIE